MASSSKNSSDETRRAEMKARLKEVLGSLKLNSLSKQQKIDLGVWRGSIVDYRELKKEFAEAGKRGRDEINWKKETYEDITKLIGLLCVNGPRIDISINKSTSEEKSIISSLIQRYNIKDSSKDVEYGDMTLTRIAECFPEYAVGVYAKRFPKRISYIPLDADLSKAMSSFFSPSFARLIPVGSDRVLVNASLVAKVDFQIKINSHKSEWKLDLERVRRLESSRLDDKDLSEEKKRNALIEVGVLDKDGKIKNKSKIMDAFKLIAALCDEKLKNDGTISNLLS